MPIKRGSCQWLRSGWKYEIEGNETEPLAFLCVRFDMSDAAGVRRMNSAGLPREDLSGLDSGYFEVEMRRIVDDVSADSELKGVAKKTGTAFAGIRRMRATARLTALLMEIDERTYGERRSASKPPHPRILKIQEIAHRLSERPGQAPPVEELAREAEYTRAHFCRAFKQITGASPQNFLIEWRMNHARSLLVETSLPVKAIAAELGYRDSEFFTRQFHERTGRTPSAFRQENPPLI